MRREAIGTAVRGIVLGAALLLAAPGEARLLARVEPGWSPFVSAPVDEDVRALAAEARGLLGSDPGRVAFILGKASLPPGPSGLVLRGLLADALYQLGGDGLLEAQRLYRSLATSGLEPTQAAWAGFMLANIHRGLGFDREAEVQYRAADGLPGGPWSPALRFDLAAIELEGGRFAEARDALAAWLEAHPGDRGGALARYLLGEAAAALGDAAAAREAFRAARELAPEAWLARPQAGYALAELLRQEGRVDEAVSLLEVLAEDRVGAPEGARARLLVGELRVGQGDVARAARSYARLLEEGTTPDGAREALLRLALLGAEHAEVVELEEPFPAYRVFYRPGPALEGIAAGRDPLAAQRALRGLSLLERKAGREEQALGLLVRIFREYPESPESGRAYEAFVAGLERYLEGRLAAGAYADVVDAHHALKGAVAWVPTREAGSLALKAAQAYEALGATSLARAVYEELEARGTREVTPAELRERILRTRAAEGDAASLARLAEVERGWRTWLALARARAASGATAEARGSYRQALEAAPRAEERLAVLAEADALGVPAATTAEMLAALGRRRAVWEALPPGPEREAWEAHGALVEARLRYASGDAQGAVRLFRSAPELAPEDRYLLGLAEAAAGRPGAAATVFRELAEGGAPLFSGLARTHLEVAGFLASGEGLP